MTMIALIAGSVMMFGAATWHAATCKALAGAARVPLVTAVALVALTATLAPLGMTVGGPVAVVAKWAWVVAGVAAWPTSAWAAGRASWAATKTSQMIEDEDSIDLTRCSADGPGLERATRIVEAMQTRLSGQDPWQEQP